MHYGNRRRSTLASFLFLLLLLAIGIGVTLHGIRGLKTSLEAQSWPTTTARVIDTDVSYQRGTSSSTGAYYPRVRYQYVVNGRTYTGDRIWTTNMGSTRGWARSIIDEFPPGSEVTVYYDPADPANALLKPGNSTPAILMLLLGILLTVIPAGGAWLILRYRPETPTEHRSRPPHAGGIPRRVAVVFSVLWFLLALPAAWEAWEGHASRWLLVVPLIGPGVVFGARTLARRQTGSRQAGNRISPAAAAFRRIRPAAPQRRANPKKAGLVINGVTLLLAAAILGSLYSAWSEFSATGLAFLIFVALILLMMLYLLFALRGLHRLYGIQTATDAGAGRKKSKLGPRYPGIWLVIPFLLVNAAIWTWDWMKAEKLRSGPVNAKQQRLTDRRAQPAPALPRPGEPGVSPCPDLIAKAQQAAVTIPDEILKALMECKMQRADYQRLKADSQLEARTYRAQLQPQLYPEERAIRQVLAILAGRRHPPMDARIYPVPAFDSAPRIDGTLNESAWSAALRIPIEGLAQGSQSQLLLGWRENTLYAALVLAAADLPQGVSITERASWMLALQPGLSPWLDYQYFFVYADKNGNGHAGNGCRIAAQVRFPLPPPPGGWPEAERWKGIRFNECGLFPAWGAAGIDSATSRRVFEAKVRLADAAIIADEPFALGILAEVAHNTIGKRFNPNDPIWLRLD